MSNILQAFNGGEVEEISALIDKLEKSSFDYFKLESERFSIVISKNGAGEDTDAEISPAAEAMPAPMARPVDTAPATQEETTADASAASGLGAAAVSAAAITEQKGIFIVKSPNYGLFYAQPEPGAPPYTMIGAVVKTGDTLGLLETMKTFTAISSPVDGEVVAIHVKNEETLEPGQPLVSIKV